MTLISKSQLSSRLGFRASPFQNPWSHITLAMWIRVRVTRDAHIIRVWGMGMPISLWQRHVAYIEAWAQYPCGRSELKLACVAGGFDSATERPSRKENGAGVCFEINGSRWTMYLEQSYQEIPDKLGFHMMLRIMQIWEVVSWFLRVKPPQIVTFSLPTMPRKNFFRPPKFQHKKFAISFSLFGQT